MRGVTMDKHLYYKQNENGSITITPVDPNGDVWRALMFGVERHGIKSDAVTAGHNWGEYPKGSSPLQHCRAMT